MHFTATAAITEGGNHPNHSVGTLGGDVDSAQSMGHKFQILGTCNSMTDPAMEKLHVREERLQAPSISRQPPCVLLPPGCCTARPGAARRALPAVHQRSGVGRGRRPGSAT